LEEVEQELQEQVQLKEHQDQIQYFQQLQQQVVEEDLLIQHLYQQLVEEFQVDQVEEVEVILVVPQVDQETLHRQVLLKEIMEEQVRHLILQEAVEELLLQ
jgi:hypothetical protein